MPTSTSISNGKVKKNALFGGTSCHHVDWAEFLEVRYSRKLDPLEEEEGR